MISHHYKCIFIHIPKAAGQSIENFFLRSLNLSWVQHGYVEQTLFDQYFKFAFVRNPWARLVSEYKYRKYYRMFDFKTFLFSHFIQSSWDDKYIHIKPQYHFLFDSRGKLLVDFIGRFEHLQEDFKLLCKRLDISHSYLEHNNTASDYKVEYTLLDKIKLIRFYSTPIQAKKRIHDDYKDFYDSETREFVEKYYAKDIQTFGYEFDQPDPQYIKSGYL